MPEEWVRKQTLVNAERYITEELKIFESEILQAADLILVLEQQLFKELIQSLQNSLEILKQNASVVAQWDVLSNFATMAKKNNYSCPKMTTDTFLDIQGARHPVIEKQLPLGTPYIANDIYLDRETQQIIMITGPNMSGKSALLRQIALISLLAQIGSFVPAESAEIGMITQLFSRVGASDDLARGRSTFMVEMVETAAILNQAGENALVILDEIGRGTATYDGLSIAWATLENLHNINNCRALFATHYHELTSLTENLEGLMNATVSVKEWKGDIIFLHEVKKGAADRSYGVQVAKLAGIPQTVIRRATEVLEKLENADQGGKTKAIINELPLFNTNPNNMMKPEGSSQIEEQIKDIHPDELTPKDALALIYKLKSFIK